MITNLDELEQTTEKNAHLTFEEYAAMREPAINVIINDYAVKLVNAANEGQEEERLTLDEAKEIAKREIPATFIPEWMKNLRISANIAGTELCYLEAVIGSLGRIEEMLSIVFEKSIDEHLTRLAEGFKREEIRNDESGE